MPASAESSVPAAAAPLSNALAFASRSAAATFSRVIKPVK